jgi:tripartite-type tricarboxylate transporter receptor subunit TctC
VPHWSPPRGCARKAFERQITIIVPAPPGGTADISARALVEPLGKALGAEANYLDPQKMTAHAQAEYTKWGQVIKVSGIKAD